MPKKSTHKSKAAEIPTNPKAKPERTELPKTIKLKEDHIQLLKDLSLKEQEARNSLSYKTLNLFQLKQQLKHISDQMTILEDEQIQPILEEIERIRNQMSEMGQSMMPFYDIKQIEGYTWRLNVDEGVWIAVKKQG